jgi:hypothetical protein
VSQKTQDAAADSRSRPLSYTSEHAELFLRALDQHARDDFGVFRRMIHPDMKWGWFTAEVVRELQQFHNAGRRPILVLLTPPQHGKSETASDFIAWTAGNNPNLNVIYASYSDALGIRANKSFAAHGVVRILG